MVESLKRQNIALFLKIFYSKRKVKKRLLSKGTELISLTVVNKNTKIKSMQYDAPKSSLEELLKLTSVGKKGMKDIGKYAELKIRIWVILSLNSPIIYPITQAKIY